MVVLGAFTDKVIVSVASCLEKMALVSDPHAFATGKTDTFAGWAYAF
jgi:hypothetical protein